MAFLGALLTVFSLGLAEQAPYLLPRPPLLGEVGKPVLVGFAFSYSGDEIIVATSEGLEVWDIGTQTKRDFKEIPGIRGFAISTSAGLVALAFEEHLEILDAASLDTIKELNYTRKSFGGRLSIKFSPSGRYLAMQNGVREIVRCDLTTNSVEHVEIPIENAARVDAFAFLTDDKLVVSAYPGLYLWEPGRKQIRKLAELPERYYTVGVNSSRGLVAYPAKGEMIVMDANTGEIIGAYPCLVGSSYTWWGFSPDGAAIFVPRALGLLRVYELGARELVCEMKPAPSTSGEVVSAAFSKDGDRVGFLELDELGLYTIRVWDWRNCSELACLDRLWSRSGGGRVAFSSDGRYLIRSTGDRLEVWDTKSRELLKMRRVLGSAFSGSSFSVSPTAPLVAAVDKYGNQIVFWNWETGREYTLNPMWFGLSRISSLCFAPNGSRLVLGDTSGNLAIWDLDRKDMVLFIAGAHQDAIQSVLCSPDGAFLISTSLSGDYTFKVWSGSTGKLLTQRKLLPSSWFFRDARTLILSGREFGKWGWQVNEVVKLIVFNDSGEILKEEYITNLQYTGKVALETISGNPLIAELVPGPTGREEFTLLRIWNLERGETVYQWRLDWVVFELIPVPGRRAVAVVREDGQVAIISVNIPPRVEFTFRPERAGPGSPIEFVATVTDPEGGPVELFWDFGDGTTAREEVVVHSFQTAGEYSVKLVAIDDAGEMSVAEHVVAVRENQLPIAKFSWTPSDPRTLEEVILRDESTDPDGEIVSRYWEIAEARFEGLEVRYRFCQPGSYPVTLTVRDAQGAEASLSAQIEVIPGSCIVGFGLLPKLSREGHETYSAPLEALDGVLGAYEVHLVPADLPLATPGTEVIVARCVSTPVGTFVVEVGKGRILACSGDTAWITVDRVWEGREVRIGDQVLFPRR